MIEALQLHVTGIVQGVGFRPFVYRLAKRYLINGWVLNAADGVAIHVEGESQLLDEFVMEISDNAPASSKVEQIEIKEVPLQDFEGFEIRFSEEAEVEKTTLVSPDLATCDDCLAELFDPADRRYRYPFINCTNCGPRFTIIRNLPYDREKTAMDAFAMCDACSAEYQDPSNRRFHAQPDACFDCGPQLCYAVLDDNQTEERVDFRWGAGQCESDAILSDAASLLRDGGILAVKGLGGFHLACDAKNAQAVEALRQRKHRPSKPLAVMVRAAQEAMEYCQVSPEERKLLESPQRPIVLLRKRKDASFPAGIADGLTEMGVMLPSTPVQHLLLNDFGGMLVMTSGNAHGNPIETDDLHACKALSGIADALLGNNRPILSRYDDSVLRVITAGSAGPTIQTIRRARGFAPMPLPFPFLQKGNDVVFATGPEQKNTFCMARQGEAFVSQHVGDMESVQVNDAWLEAKVMYQQVFDMNPTHVACDRHPEYLTSKWAASQDLPATATQHHHAHIVSAMAENGLSDAVCGIAFDGTGYGEDSNIWGGEVLLANLQAFERFANFAYFPLPGGSAAIKNPLRCAYGVLWAFDLLEHPAAQGVVDALGDAADICEQMIDKGLNCPSTSSVGRLFDAASAILGICTNPSYEGEAAVLLEAAIQEEAAVADGAEYSIDVVKNVANENSTAQDTSVLLLDAAPLFQGVLDDMQAGVSKTIIARKFHDAIVEAIAMQAQIVDAMYGIRTVVLSGGVFMNRYIVEHVLARLEQAGFTVAINRDLPPNDGCISYGQAVIAAQAL